MADLTFKDTSMPVQIVGADSAGAEGSPVSSTATGELEVSDSIDVSSVSGALSVSTTAVEAKVGVSRHANRKFISITPTNGTIYYGSTNAVTTATGMPLFKNQTLTIRFTANVPLWLIAGSAINVRIMEGS